VGQGVCLLTVIMFLPLWGCVDRKVQAEDDALASVARALLYDYEPANLLGVDIDVTDGMIYLSGEVDVFAQWFTVMLSFATDVRERLDTLCRAVDSSRRAFPNARRPG